MNTTYKYLINNRVLNTYKPLEQESHFDKEKNFLFDLSYLSILDVIGEQSIDFLQGQLTCDLRKISDIHMVQGAQCNLKGRILSLVEVINWNGVKLILPKDLLEATQISLTKTAMLSRVSLKENTHCTIMGFYLGSHDDLLPESLYFPTDKHAQAQGEEYCVYHLGDHFYVLVMLNDYAKRCSNLFKEHDRLLGSLTWHSHRLLNNQVDIYPESRGLFLPHRLGLHETSYLSFDKGCYKGQEIIARTHYRATLKHEVKSFTVKTSESIFSGQKLFKSFQGLEYGELIDYSLLNDEVYLITASVLKEPLDLVFFEGHVEGVRLI